MEKNNASIDYYKNSVVIKCPPDVEFRAKLKEHGGSWNPSLRSWVFGKENGDIVWGEVQKDFKDWTLTDNRTKKAEEGEDEGVVATE